MKTTNKILLIQPRHTYAPNYAENKLGHIYLPTSLITIASFLKACGIQIDFRDENIEEVQDFYEIVGINLLGAPYIPKVKQYEATLQSKFGEKYKLFIGGQIVNGLAHSDFTKLFSPNVINGNIETNLVEHFQIKYPIPKITDLSHIEVFETLPSGYLELYLQQEIGFYLSQGCKYSCSFCSATRTKTINGVTTNVKEQYRNIEVALKDLAYLGAKAKEFNHKKLDIYLSNLDLFQSPLQLTEFAIGVIKLREELDFNFTFRGLATVASFLQVHEKTPNVIKLMQQAGLKQVGFGIDGATPEVYKKTRKPQNVQMCLDAISISRQVYNITPETLMVFGHNGKEDENSLKQAVIFCTEMSEKYGAYPRPHIAKDIVPGNDGWNDNTNYSVKQKYYSNISLFQNLDFTALPSPITHPDEEFRKLVAKYYSQICNLPNSLTQYVLPEDDSLPTDELKKIKDFNKYRYDL